MNLGEKIKIGNFIKYTKKSEIILLNIRGRLIPMYSLVHKQRLMEKTIGLEKTRDLLYTNGHFWGTQIWDMTAKKMGMNKKLPKLELLKANVDQGRFSGIGKIEIKKFDEKNKKIILHMNSVFADEYKRIFGISKHSVDYEIEGGASAYGERIFGEDSICEETKCIAKGDSHCEFVITIKNKKNKNSKILKTFKELGGKKNPYTDNTYYKL